MAILQTSSPFVSYCSSSASLRKTRATLYNPNVSVRKPLINDEFNQRKGLITFKTTNPLIEIKLKLENNGANKEEISNSMVLQETYAIMDIVAGRVEMHKNIGAQRDNWNRLLLNSVNGMTTTAATMAGIAAVNGSGASFMALKLSSSLLYMAATGVLLVMNKIQPSQLAEEQRNASRLFKKLHEEIKTNIAIGNPDWDDVKAAMEKVLALDEAYPLPLLGTMLDKFPSLVQPAVWWPEERSTQQEKLVRKVEKNGWNENLEEEMKEIVGIVKRKDTEEYMRLSKLVLKINKILAISGPLFTGIAAVGSALMGSSFYGSFAAILSVVFGAMAVVANSLEHGGQIGMVFEMYRNSAGFLRFMGETIESTLEEGEADERENGELFEVKVALQLGRSLSELRDLADDASHPHSSMKEEDGEEFASKLL
ncbi:probable F-box protein At4g22030 [Durio zibethinus]|uniref:Probable F-box protein At4g22030 n=1 Tax=Durio zibethinus TaxID=66656 RepID=A0A6P5WM72_DURZI|nr:probable F-box protein At4g22030 [Durio zibethinus]